MYTPKNIVVCLDGTGNQIEENISNVLKLYRTLDKNGTKKQKQVVFYDQGVGTIGQQYTWGMVSQKIGGVLGLATGHGLDRNVLRAYRFIVRNYHEESEKDGDGKRITIRDKIYIFGYSRGAHTARVLAAFIYNMGVLKVEQIHLAGSTLAAYKRANKRKGTGEIKHFNRVTQSYEPAVKFVGVWDTVSSMIVPRKDRLYLPAIEKLRDTRENPGVKVFRQAMSIDENRYMFRLDAWKEPQDHKRNISIPDKTSDQDSMQVWFAGHHGDVGGGNKRAESGLSQYPLCWMIKQSIQFGLVFNTRMVDYVAQGIPYTKTTKYNYPKPDHGAKMHGSYKSPWAVLEIFPKFSKFREWKGKGKGRRPAIPGLYIPWWEPRAIPEGANIHISAVTRKQDASAKYNPVNFPKNYTTIEHDKRKSKEWHE